MGRVATELQRTLEKRLGEFALTHRKLHYFRPMCPRAINMPVPRGTRCWHLVIRSRTIHRVAREGATGRANSRISAVDCGRGRRTDGRTDGRTDARTRARTDGRTEEGSRQLSKRDRERKGLATPAATRNRFKQYRLAGSVGRQCGGPDSLVVFPYSTILAMMCSLS